MKQIIILACLLHLFLLLNSVKSDEEHVRNALLEFMSKLSSNNGIPDANSGWNSSSYPCKDGWRGVTCDDQGLQVKEIVLDGLSFAGVFDARIICNARSLSSSLLVIDITNNSVKGENFDDIQNCFQLTELFIGWNEFTNLTHSISKLKNLKILDVSNNKISGALPGLSEIKGLTVFRAQENRFSGAIPDLDFSNFSEFNVSVNNLTGAIPIGAQRFKLRSFVSNPLLCGPPLPNNCTSINIETDTSPAQPKQEKNGVSKDQILMYTGYILIGLAVLLFIFLCLYKRGKTKKETLENSDNNKVAAIDDSTMTMTKPSFSTVELKAGGVISKTDYSTASIESGQVSSSVVVLTSPEVNGLRFEDLLKAPAELLGRGNHGSVYKVVCEAQGMTVAVKRIKDWRISSSEFRQRMRRLNQVKHPNVLPAVAYYSSSQEKLMVYEYQQNGSLFRLIHAHGNQSKQPLDWSSRLSYAATIADTLAYMHEELQLDRIPHGNLKSSNILINKNMEPCISEYGLMLEQNQEQSSILANTALQAAQDKYKSMAVFKTDTYAYGVILLELLTGRTALTEGLDLGSWVLAVVREEWTVEVFDRNLVREGANEERMVNVLQIAIKCVNKSPEARPTMRQVASAIRAARDDDERSLDVSDLSMTRSFADLSSLM